MEHSLKSIALKELSRTSSNTNHRNEVTTVQSVAKLVHKGICAFLDRNFRFSAKKEPTKTIEARIFATIVRLDFTAKGEPLTELRVHLASLLMELSVLLASLVTTVRLRAPQ